MARNKEETAVVNEEPLPTLAPRKRANRKTREMAQLLRNIGSKYVDASMALSKGDDEGVQTALAIIGTYQDLFNKLSQQAADTITGDGLAATSES